MDRPRRHLHQGTEIARSKGAFFGEAKRVGWRVSKSIGIFFNMKHIILHMGVSKNRGTPKSSILIRFSIINYQGGGFKYFLFSPRSLGKMNPIWLIFFSKGLKPPTRKHIILHIWDFEICVFIFFCWDFEISLTKRDLFFHGAKHLFGSVTIWEPKSWGPALLRFLFLQEEHC